MADWLRKIVTRVQAELRLGAPRARTAQRETAEGSQSRPASFSSDQPIASKTADRFGRWPFAKRIGDTIARRSDASSLVIGLYGPWGDGKTSTLRLMELALQDHSHVVTIHFNPWAFGSEQQLLRGFFDSLADGLGRSLTTRREEAGNILRKYGSILTLASVSVAGGLVTIGAGDAVQGLGESLSAVELDELRRRLEDLLKASGKRLVVLIDDIDRLDRDEVHAILKLVKLSAGFDHTSYVLAFDDEVVSAAIGQRYGAGDTAAGKRFLEKIVQVPLRLPPPDKIELRKLTFDGINEALSVAEITLPQPSVDAFVRHFVDGLEPQLRTPRQANLYRNALTFALPLLKGETHPVDALLIEGIRVFYPNLYIAIRDNGNRFIRGSREDSQRAQEARARLDVLIDEALDNADPRAGDAVKTRLVPALFPRTGTSGYGPEWDLRWATEQRICSGEYFQRYFTYTVPPRDVSDAEIADLLDSLKASRVTPAEADKRLLAIAQRGAMDKMVLKLRHREEDIDLAAARELALLVARNGAYFPNPRSLFSHAEPFAQAAILCGRLLRRIPDHADRQQLANNVLAAADPLPFAYECFKWIRHSKGAAEDQRTLPEAVEAEAGRRLATRIKDAATKGPLYRQFSEAAPALYWVWKAYGEAPDLEEHLRASLNISPNEVEQFMDGFVGYSWGMESGLSSRSDLDRSTYDAIAAAIDPAIVFAKLRERFGSDLETSEYDQSDDLPFSLRIARQFSFVHRKVIEDKAKS